MNKFLKMEQRNKEAKEERRHEKRKRKRNITLLKIDCDKEKLKMDK